MTFTMYVEYKVRWGFGFFLPKIIPQKRGNCLIFETFTFLHPKGYSLICLIWVNPCRTCTVWRRLPVKSANAYLLLGHPTASELFKRESENTDSVTILGGMIS